MSDTKMVFVWDDVLYDHGPGMVVVVAESAVEAYEEIRKHDELTESEKGEILSGEADMVECGELRFVRGGS